MYFLHKRKLKKSMSLLHEKYIPIIPPKKTISESPNHCEILPRPVRPPLTISLNPAWGHTSHTSSLKKFCNIFKYIILMLRHCSLHLAEIYKNSLNKSKLNNLKLGNNVNFCQKQPYFFKRINTNTKYIHYNIHKINLFVKSMFSISRL